MSRSLCGNPCSFDPALHCEQPLGHQDEFCRTRGKLTDTTTWANPNSAAPPVPEDLFRPRPRLSAKERMKRNEAVLKPMADRVQLEGRSEQPDAKELRTRLARADDSQSSHVAAALVEGSVEASKRRVLAVLTAAKGKWVSGNVLVEVGGAEGLRRLRQLRDEGLMYERRPSPSGGRWEYRLPAEG